MITVHSQLILSKGDKLDDLGGADSISGRP